MPRKTVTKVTAIQPPVTPENPVEPVLPETNPITPIDPQTINNSDEPKEPALGENAANTGEENSSEEVESSEDINPGENSTGENSEDEESDPSPRQIKSGFARVRISNFRGTFRNVSFDDEGVCSRISVETLKSLHQQFPGIEIVSAEELD